MIVATRETSPTPINSLDITSKLNDSLTFKTQLINYRNIINSNELMNSINNLNNYIDLLFDLLNDQYNKKSQEGTSFDSIQAVLQFADEIVLFKGISTSPWSYILSASHPNFDWTILDEISMSVISLSYLINLITVESFESLLKDLRSSKIDDNSFILLSNYLKNSFKFLNLFNGKDVKRGSNYSSYSSNLSFISISNNLLFQLNFIFKNHWMIVNNIDFDFNNLLKFTNLSTINTLSKLSIYCFNELNKLRTLTTTTAAATTSTTTSSSPAATNESRKRDLFKLKSSSSSSSSSSHRQSIESFVIYLEIIYSFYQSIYHYHKSQMDVALSLIQWSLINSIDLNPLKSKLKLDLNTKNPKTKETNSKLEKFLTSFKSNDANLKLNSNFQLPPLFVGLHLRYLIQLMRNLFIKFQKENNTLYFKELLSVDELESNHLFNSKNLPDGMSIPLTNLKIYSPKFIADKPNSNDYF